MPKISIISPIYQMEEFLEEFIAMVIHQDFEDFEFILVNDGSTDTSGDICDRFAEEDNRIRVIHQNNCGQGYARNAGLNVARGDYIGFLDPDDLISKDMFSHLYNIAVNYNVNIAECKMSITKTRFVSNKQSFKEESIQIYENKDTLEYYLIEGLKNNTKYSLCNKLYKREIFLENRFGKINYSEDYLMNFKLFLKARRTAQSDKVCYYYYQRKGSSIHKPLTKDNLKNLDNMEEAIGIAKTINDKKVLYYTECTSNRLYFSFYLKYVVYGNDQTITKEIIDGIYRNFKKSYKMLIKSPIPLNRKLIMSVLYVNKNIFVLVKKILHNDKKRLV